MILEMTVFALPANELSEPAAAALAPGSRFKPFLEVIENPDGTYEIIRDDEAERKWDQETVRSVRAGETTGYAFRNRVAFREIGMLIGQFLHLKVSPYTLKEEIKRHIDPVELAVSRTRHDPLLAGSAIDELTYNIFEEAYYLPLYRDGEKALYYRYYVNKDPVQPPDITIPIGDGREVYIDVINARAVIEEISELQYIAHDVRNAFGKFNIIRYFFTLVGDTSLEHGMNEIEGLNKELEGIFHNIPQEASSPAVVRGIMRELKTAATKADRILSPENTRPRLEKAYDGLVMQGVIQGTDEEKERYVDDAVLSFIHAKNILQGHFLELRGNVKEMTVDEVNETIKAALALIPIKDRTTVDLVTGGQTVYAEKIALMRVMTNIIKNASEAFALGGKRCEKGGLHIATRFIDGGKKFQIMLTDKAGGMPEEVRENIFKKGFSTKKANLGAKRGQGLAIAKKYMETHCGGTIDVASTLGEGTTFTLTLSAWDRGRALREERERTIVALRSIRHGKGQDLFDLTDCAHTACSAWTLVKEPEESRRLMRKMQSLGNQMFMLSLKGLDREKYDETLKGFRKTMIEMLEIVKQQRSMVPMIGAGGTDIKNKKMIIETLVSHLAEIEAKLQSRIGLIAGTVPGQTNNILPILERTAQKKYRDTQGDDIETLKYSNRELPDLKVAVADIIARTVYYEEPTTERQKKIRILPLNKAGKDTHFKGDTLSVQSAISNIVDNAVHFAGLTTDEEGLVKIVAYREEGGLKIDIIDNGTGVPREFLQMDPVTGKRRLFDLDATLREGGTGLGLAEAWYAINDHGGSIEADSLVESEYKRMEIDQCVEGMYLADAMENDPDLRKTVKEAYDKLEPRLKGFNDWLNGVELEDETAIRQVLNKYREEIKGPTTRFLNDSVKTGPLRRFLYDRFVSKGFIRICSLEDCATTSDLVQDMIQYNKMMEIFKRLAKGKRILPGTTFTITLPEYAENDGIPETEDIIRATVRENMNALEEALRDDDDLKYHTREVYTQLAECTEQMGPVFNKILNTNLTKNDINELDKQMGSVKACLKKANSLRENERTAVLWEFIQDSFGQIPFVVHLLASSVAGTDIEKDGEIPEEQGKVRSVVNEYKALMDALKNLTMIGAEDRYGRAVVDGLRLLPAPEEKKPFVIALGTSWIKGYEEGRYLQYDAINPLITAIERYCEDRGIIFVRGDDERVARKINELKEKTPDVRGIVLAGKATIDIMEKELERGNFVLAGVDNKDLTVDSFIPLSEMFALALEIYRAGEVNEKYIKGLHPGLEKLGFTYSGTNDRRIDFAPKAEPLDYEILRKNYGREREPIMAA